MKRGHLKPADHCDDFNCLPFHKTKLVIFIFPAKDHELLWHIAALYATI